jgi:hypothetical protein
MNPISISVTNKVINAHSQKNYAMLQVKRAFSNYGRQLSPKIEDKKEVDDPCPGAGDKKIEDKGDDQNAKKQNGPEGPKNFAESIEVIEI